MRTPWEVRLEYVRSESPDLLNSFACHVEAVIRFLVSNAYLYIQDLDTSMYATEDLNLPFHDDVADLFVRTLHYMTLRIGPTFLRLLLETNPRFATWKHFSKFLYDVNKSLRAGKSELENAHIDSRLVNIIRLMKWSHESRWLGRFDMFGVKHVGQLDLTEWIKAVPDDETWFHLMQERRWVEPERPVREILHLSSQA